MTLLARAAGSPIAHRVADRADETTLCGKPARLMAKWAPHEAGVDRRTWRTCDKCGDAENR